MSARKHMATRMRMRAMRTMSMLRTRRTRKMATTRMMKWPRRTRAFWLADIDLTPSRLRLDPVAVGVEVEVRGLETPKEVVWLD